MTIYILSNDHGTIVNDTPAEDPCVSGVRM